MEKVLITGVAGFIGSNLAESLLRENKFKVIGIDNLSYGLKKQIPDGVEFYKLDIRSKDIHQLFKGIDCIFHLAAKNCISDCQDSPVETSDINVTGTLNVLEAARRNGVKKVIYAESSAIYEKSNIFPTPETEEKPQSFYGYSKLASSLFAQIYSERYDMDITGLRYFNVYGPRQDYRRTIPPVMSAFIISLYKNERPIIYGNGEKRRDFIYVDDVNDFHLMAMEDERTKGNIYNLGFGINYSIIEIYGMIKSLMNKDILPQFSDDLPCEAQATLADISKARGLGWKPKVSLEEGLKLLIQYINKNVMTNIS